MAKGRLEPKILPSGGTQDILKKDISVPSDATRVSVQPEQSKKGRSAFRIFDKPITDQIPFELNLVTSIGMGLISGRRQRAVEEAFLSGVDIGSGVSPQEVERARRGGPIGSANPLSLGRNWVEPGTPEERIAAGKAVEEAISRADDAMMPAARRRALAALEKGDAKELARATLSDPIGVLGFGAAESLARSPEAVAFSLFHRLGSAYGSFDAEQRSGFVNELRKELQKRGGSVSNPDDVIELLSDKEALQRALDTATKGAVALSGTELGVDIGTTALAKRFPAAKLFKSRAARTLFKGLLQLGGEMLGESAGEVARQVGTGEEVNFLDAAFEGIHTIFQSTASVGGLKAFEDLRVAKVLEDAKVLGGPRTEGIRQASFAGPLALTANRSKKVQAEHDILLGKDPEEVRRDTGWFQDDQGFWRFEIDDSEMQVNEQFFSHMVPVTSSSRVPPSGHPRLGNLVDHPKLFAAYPDLRNIGVAKVDFDIYEPGTRGIFNAQDQVLYLNSSLRGDEIKDVVTHELQHAVQDREGFLGPPVERANQDPFSKAPQALVDRVARETQTNLAQTIPNLYDTYQELNRTPSNRIIGGQVGRVIDSKLAAIQNAISNLSGTNSQRAADTILQSWDEIKDTLADALFAEGFIADTVNSIPPIDYFLIHGINIPNNARDMFRLYRMSVYNQLRAVIRAKQEIDTGIQGDQALLRQALGKYAPYQGYEALFHEVEARDAAARRRLTEEQRKSVTPYSSQDVRVPKGQRILTQTPQGPIFDRSAPTGSGRFASRTEGVSPITRLVSRAEKHPFRQKDVRVARDSEWDAYRRLVEQAVTRGIKEGLVDEGVLSQLEQADSFWYSGDKGRATTFIDDALRQVHRGNEAQTHAAMLEGLSPEEVEAELAEIDPQDAERIRRVLRQKDRSTIEQTSEEEGTDLSQFRAQGFLGNEFINTALLSPPLRNSLVHLERIEDPQVFSFAKDEIREHLKLDAELLIDQLEEFQNTGHTELIDETFERLNELRKLDRLLDTLTPEDFPRLRGGEGPDLSQFRSMGFDPGDRFRDRRRPGGEGDLPPRRAPSDDELAELAGVSKAIIARTREKLNLQQIPEPKVKGHAVALQSAIQKGIPDKALEIASRVQAAPRTLSQEEVVGLALAVAKLEQRHDELMSRAELMVDAGDTRTANGYKELADQIIEEIDAIEVGARAGITEVARALAAVGSAFDTQTLTLSRVRRNAKVSRGRPLTEREEAQIRDAVRKLREAEQREKEALAKLEQAESQALQRLAEKALIAKAKEAQKQAKTENRAQKLEQVRKEREEILKQLRNKGFNIQSAGLDPEVAWLIAKLANTYIQEGIIGLDALVNKVLDHLPELSRDDVMEGVAMMNQQSEKEVRQQVIEKVEELKETNDLLEAVEQLRKKDPKKAEQMLNQIHNFAAKTMTEDERLLEVEKQIQAIRTKLQAGVPPPKERRPQAPASPELQAKLDELRDLKRLLRLEQKIADLQQQLDTGIFKETPKKKAATVTPATEELKRAQVRLAQARRAVRALTKGPTPFQKRDVVLEPIRLMRQLITTGEMSGTLRQGLGMIMAQPSKLPKHFATAFAAFFKSDVADEVEFMIQTSKWQPILQEMGVDFTYRQGLNEREELFMSKLLERTPAMKELLQDNHPAVKKLLLAGPASVKSIVNAAERHMTTFLNLYRMSIATQAIEQFGTEDMGTLKQLGKLINDLSGRGNFEMGPGSFASIIAFAPRFTVSRFSAPVRSAMVLANPKLRRLAIAGFLRTAIWGASWFAFASMLGGSIGSDPEDTDFGKIIFGNTRIDVWGGFQQPYSWLLRLALIGYKNWAEKPDEPVPDAYDMITRFALYKASPAVTFTATLLARKTPVGEDISSLGIIGSNTVPLFLQDAYETGKREGVLAGAGVAVGTGLGLNIQTWGSEMEAGDIKPIFKKAKYKPRPTQYPDEIKNNPDLKQRYDFIFGALVAKKVRENKSILDVSTPEQTKKLLQSWATEARATMKPYVDGKIENERTLQQLVEREGIVEEVR